MSSPSKKPAPHSHMASSTGMMLRPNGVRKSLQFTQPDELFTKQALEISLIFPIS